MIQMKPKLMLGSSLVLIALLAFAPIYSANAVDAAPYLRLGAGAQSIGVGGAVTATVDDATATVWNPAGLASVKNTTFTVSTFNMGYDARQSFLGIAKNLGNGSIGLAVSGVTVDGIENRDGNDIRRGTFRPTQTRFHSRTDTCSTILASALASAPSRMCIVSMPSASMDFVAPISDSSANASTRPTVEKKFQSSPTDSPSATSEVRIAVRTAKAPCPCL